jgi:SAM-dependent methyltransferase
VSALAPAACPHAAGEALYGGLLSRCSACRLVRTIAPPGVEYAETYFTDDARGGYDFESPFARAFDQARFGPELRRLERLGLRGSVLDVGCATGSFLSLARAGGWEVAGVEVAAYARGVASARAGVAISATLGDLPAGRRYDVVTLHHVLEHVESPLDFLRDEVLPRVGRRLLVEVPNFASLGARADGPRWRDLRPDQHLRHFTPETLQPILRQAGFEPLAAYSLWQPLWSLRAPLDIARQVAGVLPFRRASPSGVPGRPAGVTDVAGYAPPRGLKRWAVEATRIGARPLVAALETAGLGERLVVEAEPGSATGRGSP